MNTIKSTPFFSAVLNALVVFAGAFGTIYVLSLIDKVSILTKIKDPVMMIILIACPIISGVSAIMKARKQRLAVEG